MQRFQAIQYMQKNTTATLQNPQSTFFPEGFPVQTTRFRIKRPEKKNYRKIIFQKHEQKFVRPTRQTGEHCNSKAPQVAQNDPKRTEKHHQRRKQSTNRNDSQRNKKATNDKNKRKNRKQLLQTIQKNPESQNQQSLHLHNIPNEIRKKKQKKKK